MRDNLLFAAAAPPGPEADEVSAAIRLRAFLDAALDAVVGIDGDGRITEFNRAAEGMFGYDAAEVVGQPMAELLIPPRLREAHERGLRAALASSHSPSHGMRLELPALRSDGTEFPVELGIARIDTGGRPGFVAFLRDLSDTRRVQANLHQAEVRNRTLVEQLPQVTYIEELDQASASYISPQIEGLVGYTPEEWTSDPGFFEKVLHPDDRERVLAGFSGMHATGQRFECEYRLVARDGSIVWVHDGAVVVHDARTGRPLYAQGFMVDISGRKQTEQALRESEQRFRDLVSGIDVILWESDPAFNFSFVSRRAEDILGYPIERWLSEPAFITHYFHPDDRERVLSADREFVTGSEDYELEYRILAADGRTLWFREIVRVETDELGKANRLRGVMVDITAQKLGEAARAGLEEQLRQAQKMEAVGRLAGGIAHDFNNLLTAISGYGSLAVGRLGDSNAAVRTDLAQIQAASQQAAALTQQLLAFSRQQVMSPKVLDLNEVVLVVERLLRRLIGEHIEVTTATTGQPLPVEADPAALEQVLINLAINARDAMPDGGRLTIASSHREIDETAAAAVQDARPGAFAIVSVTDTGHGIDAETMANIFEPFFTTKEIGKGTGLGLATVYGTVRQSDGFIAVESEPGRGTTFSVHLPLSEHGLGPAVEAVEPATAGGSETILLVEDADVVRELTSKALELEGYTVLAAATPADALAVAERTEYDLLLTDVVMPQMRGGELARQLSALRPGLKVLFMSGYLDGEALLDEASPSAFLQKPFRLDELAACVRALLDA